MEHSQGFESLSTGVNRQEAPGGEADKKASPGLVLALRLAPQAPAIGAQYELAGQVSQIPPNVSESLRSLSCSPQGPHFIL